MYEAHIREYHIRVWVRLELTHGPKQAAQPGVQEVGWPLRNLYLSCVWYECRSQNQYSKHNSGHPNFMSCNRKEIHCPEEANCLCRLPSWNWGPVLQTVELHQNQPDLLRHLVLQKYNYKGLESSKETMETYHMWLCTNRELLILEQPGHRKEQKLLWVAFLAREPKQNLIL